MNKTDLETLNGYLAESFQGYNIHVKLDNNFNFEINYITGLNIQLKSKIIVPQKFKTSYLEFCKFLLNSEVISQIITILYQFYIKDLEYLRVHNN